jgi:hypothetical protein
MQSLKEGSLLKEERFATGCNSASKRYETIERAFLHFSTLTPAVQFQGVCYVLFIFKGMDARRRSVIIE